MVLIADDELIIENIKIPLILIGNSEAIGQSVKNIGIVLILLLEDLWFDFGFKF